VSSRAFEAVVFDCGGTLLVQSPSPAEIFCRVAGELLGRPIDLPSVERAYQCVELAHRQSAIDIAAAGGDKARFHDEHNRLLCLALGLSSHHGRLSPALQAAFRRERRWRASPDAVPALDRLAGAGTPLHVVANWDAALGDVLAAAGLGGRFASIASSAALGVEKPDPRVFDQLLAGGLRPSRCLYVGDDYALDVIAARGAGLVPVLVDRAARYPDADCARVSSLEEVAALVAG
jgi:FMN phosphatase YigB (HAD superfamily)